MTGKAVVAVLTLWSGDWDMHLVLSLNSPINGEAPRFSWMTVKLNRAIESKRKLHGNTLSIQHGIEALVLDS